MIAAIYARQRSKLWMVLALIVVGGFGAHQAWATTMVVYRDDTQFAIAADGLQSRKGRPLGGQQLSPRVTCKIATAGKTIFGVGGFLPATFNIFEDVADIFSRTSTIQAGADQIIDVLTPKINSWLGQRGSDHVRDVFGRKKGDQLTQIVFGAFEGASPVARVVVFELVTADPPHAKPITIWACPHSTLCTGNMAFIGEDSVMKKRFQALYSPSLSLADYLGSLVQLEIDARSPGVGPPIAIAELTSRGISWPRKGAC